MTRQEAKQWLALFGDLPDDKRHPCKHGHDECSTEHRGECLDEVITAACNPPEESLDK